MSTDFDNQDEFDPQRNPAEVDYSEKFNPQGHDNTSSMSSKPSSPRDESPFRYTGDKDRDSLAQKEASGSKEASTAEKSELSSVASRTGEGGWNTKVRNNASRKKGLGGLLSGKKKAVLAAGAGAGLTGGLVGLIFMIIPFTHLASLTHLDTILDTNRSGRSHRRATNIRSGQYTLQEMIDQGPKQGKLAAKLGRYNPVAGMKNAAQNGAMELIYSDGKSKWLRRPTQDLTQIRIGTNTIDVPPGGLKNIAAQKDFMRQIDSALGEADFMLGKSRHTRTKVANAIFKAKDIKLSRWATKGRGIKTMADAVRSMVDNIKRPRNMTSSIPDVEDSADRFDDGLDEALKDVTRPEQVSDAISDHMADSVKQTSGGVAIARKASMGVMVAMLYCAANDYIGQQEKVAEAKAQDALATAMQLKSSASQGNYGDTTAVALDLDANLNTGFETSYAFQSAVGVDPLVLQNKEPDLDMADIPIVDTKSDVYKILKLIKDSGHTAIKNGISMGILNLDPTDITDDFIDRAIDEVCKGLNSTTGAIALAGLEFIGDIALAIVTGTTGAAAKQVASQGAREVVKITFKEAVKKIGLRKTGWIALKATGKKAVSMGAEEAIIAFLMDKLFGVNTSSFDTGPARAAKQDMGYKLLHNETALAMGGRTLTGIEVSQVKKMDRDMRLAELHKKSLWYRLASIENPYSVTSRVAMSYPKSNSSMVATLRSLALQNTNPVHTLASAGAHLSTATLPTEVAYAAIDETEDINEYLIPTVGFSVSEMNRMLDESYWPRENAALVEAPGRLEQLEEAYGKCYNMLPDGKVMMDQPPEREDCDTEYLTSDWALRYRLYLMDGGLGSDDTETREDFRQGLLGQLLDFQTITAATEGSSTADSGEPGGTWTPGERGQKGTPVAASETVPTQGCGGITGGVHKSIAAQVEALCAAAAGDGVNLTGSGWRDNANQIRLRKAHCGSSHYAIYEMPSSSCRPPTAKPGSSQHEAGLAIDFDNCSKSSACFKWLSANAARFGMFNLPSESWHWSTSGS